MKTVIQRVSRASVTIGGKVKSEIGKGYLILLGVAEGDTEEDVDWLVKKTASLRVFDDDEGVMNLPVTAVGGEILVVSQFTLRRIRRATAPLGYTPPATRYPSRSTRASARSSAALRASMCLRASSART